MYFVTICTHRREALFGAIVDETMQLSPFGNIVRICWEELPNHFPFVVLDAFVVMPNHVHGIITLNQYIVGARHASPKLVASPTTTAKSLGATVGSYKSAVTKRINEACKKPGAVMWQRGYYDRIIRDERELTAIREYILYNPMKWDSDENNPLRTWGEACLAPTTDPRNVRISIMP